MLPTGFVVIRMLDKYQDEIELITGKVYNGDLTPIVFDLVKDSRHLDSLYQYLTGEILKHDINNNTGKVVRAQDSDRPCFEKWFKQCERL